MYTKEMPRRVRGRVVVKSVFLGWLRDYTPGMPGYFAFVITHDEADRSDAPKLRAHVMRAPGRDNPWREHEVWGASDRPGSEDLSIDQANELFAEHEKLAVWGQS